MTPFATIGVLSNGSPEIGKVSLTTSEQELFFSGSDEAVLLISKKLYGGKLPEEDATILAEMYWVRSKLGTVPWDDPELKRRNAALADSIPEETPEKLARAIALMLVQFASLGPVK